MPKDDTIVIGMDIILYNIRVYNSHFHNGASKAIEDAASYYMDKLTNNTSKTTSLSQLRAMDHPYARRHGKGRKVPGHRWKWQVNKQAGRLVSAAKRTKKIHEIPIGHGVTAFEVAFLCGFDPGKAPEVNYVIFGTKKMVPRPVVAQTFHHNRKGIKMRIIRGMGRAHTFAVGSFKETTKGLV